MKILLTSDGSDYSRHALLRVDTLAKCEGAEVVLLVVVQRPAPAVTDMIGPPYVDYGLVEQQYLKEGREILETSAKLLEARGLRPRRLLREGDPGETILEVAKDEAADLIVMGSHGRSGLTRFLLGSVSDRVITHARCSVLIVKSPPAGPGSPGAAPPRE